MQQGARSVLPSFSEVSARWLNANEISYPIGTGTVPLVLEPKEGDSPSALVRFIANHSIEVRRAIYEHGAVLFRGFAIRSAANFELVISSIPGMRPMDGYFMAEAGRTLMQENLRVFHTNTRFKTGGSFEPLGRGFHSENYFTLDTPAFQSFWCKRSPWLGGETALIHVGRAYPELPPEMRGKLERDPVCTPNAWSISQIADAYGLPEDFVGSFFEELGLPALSVEDERYVVLQKASVWRHPYTNELTLPVNVSAELPELEEELRGLLEPHYSGRRWGLHRLAWRHPALLALLIIVDTGARRLLFQPADWMRAVRGQLRRRPRALKRARRGDSKHDARRQRELTSARRLGKHLDGADVRDLARALGRHCTVFPWRRGDILIWDNLQILHAGMPGLGPRELGVMLCNPISVAYPLRPEPARVTVDNEYVSVDARLRRAALAQCATS